MIPTERSEVLPDKCYIITLLVAFSCCFQRAVVRTAIGELCFANGKLCFENEMLCFAIGMLCFENEMLCFENEMLCFAIGMLCFAIGKRFDCCSRYRLQLFQFITSPCKSECHQSHQKSQIRHQTLVVGEEWPTSSTNP